MGGRKVRIEASQLHGYYVTWLDGKKRIYEDVGTDALTAMQCKRNREALLAGVEGAEKIVAAQGSRITVADAVEELATRSWVT